MQNQIVISSSNVTAYLQQLFPSVLISRTNFNELVFRYNIFSVGICDMF